LAKPVYQFIATEQQASTNPRHARQQATFNLRVDGLVGRSQDLRDLVRREEHSQLVFGVVASSVSHGISNAVHAAGDVIGGALAQRNEPSHLRRAIPLRRLLLLELRVCVF